MAPRRILIIQGHPDPAGGHFGHALADSYATAALVAGHRVERIDVAHFECPLLRSQAEWQDVPPPAVKEAQDKIARANHLVVFFPLWLGTMPAVLKAFLEQVLRPGFAVVYADRRLPRRGLIGKSGRVVVTMGMPALWYRWFFRAHGVRGLERSILGFCGVKPIRETFIGLVEANDGRARERWLTRLAALGRKGI